MISLINYILSDEQPLVTIIIPLKNGARYIDDALLSAQKLSTKNIEIIVLNDNSVDNSPKIVAELAEKDPRIRLINFTEPLGYLNLLIAGIHHAKGQYISFLRQSDSFPNPEIFKILTDLAVLKEADFLHFSTYIYTQHSKHEHNKVNPNQPAMVQPRLLKRFIRNEVSATIFGKMFGAEMMKNATFLLQEVFEQNATTTAEYALIMAVSAKAKHYLPVIERGYEILEIPNEKRDFEGAMKDVVDYRQIFELNDKILTWWKDKIDLGTWYGAVMADRLHQYIDFPEEEKQMLCAAANTEIFLGHEIKHAVRELCPPDPDKEDL
ncbi:Glycosyl_transferase family 2 protein [Hexamita inflata]|uniref:Glycosyl transferase family 2 protein n=1 Tax=Hexamita inflata TaxID=28002 RepID=A0AA86QT88_9EUKA|nr:Glycosyl transferase family 2 protein [Hexamita inflata]